MASAIPCREQANILGSTGGKEAPLAISSPYRKSLSISDNLNGKGSSMLSGCSFQEANQEEIVSQRGSTLLVEMKPAKAQG